MKIGIFYPSNLPESFRVCVENITAYFPDLGLSPFHSDLAADLGAADVVWDPRAGGGNPPHTVALEANRPMLVTLHGVAPQAIPRQYVKTYRERIALHWENHRKFRAWKKLHTRCDMIVTVSNYSKSSIIEHLPIPREKVRVIYNGVDYALFSNATNGPPVLDVERPYFLHISNDEPRKNVDGILQAYERLHVSKRWPLVLKLSGDRTISMSGVTFIKQRLSDQQIAQLYQHAGAFVFPSYYEGFGLPIVEAFAAGCPVITSNGNACAEVGGDIAQKVDPSSVVDLAAAMQSRMEGSAPAFSRTAAQARAKQFSWESAARQFARLFKEISAKSRG